MTLDQQIAEMQRRRRAQLDQILQRGQQSGPPAPVGAEAPATPQAQGSNLPAMLGAAEAVGAGLVGAGVIPAASGGGLASLIALFSSRRFKQDIETLEQIGDLRWVRFRYDPELGFGDEVRVGLIAEEIAETHPEWVIWSEEREPVGITYGRIPRELRPSSWL